MISPPQPRRYSSSSVLSIYPTDGGYRELASQESGTESDATPPRDAVAPLTPHPRVDSSGGCVAGAGRRVAGAGRRAAQRIPARLTAQLSGAAAAIKWVMERRGFGPEAIHRAIVIVVLLRIALAYFS